MSLKYVTKELRTRESKFKKSGECAKQDLHGSQQIRDNPAGCKDEDPAR